MNKIVIYTAIFGDYDVFLKPKYISNDCDYICFTDNIKKRTKNWELREISSDELSPHMLNRKIKILPHRFLPEYKFSIYVDGNIEIIGNVKELIDNYLQNWHMVCFKHPVRNCIYQEAEVCIKSNKDDPQVIRQQMQRYRRLGYPENNGLTDNSVLLRKHNEPSVIRVMEEWWSEVQKDSKRDQLSFCFAAWKHNFKYALLDEGPRNYEKRSHYFRVYLHKSERINPLIFNIYIHIKSNRNKNIIYFFLFNFFRYLKWIVKAVFKIKNNG